MSTSSAPTLTLPKLVGLYSPTPGCGKSTVAIRMCKEYGYTLRPFAGPLKKMVVSFLLSMGYSSADAKRLVYIDKERLIEEIGVTSRYLQQTLGTEWGREHVHKNVWLTAWAGSLQHCGHVVVDDVRFPNEADLVVAMGGEVWRIERQCAAATGSAHESDGALATWGKFSRTIHNDATKHSLYADLHRELCCGSVVIQRSAAS